MFSKLINCISPTAYFKYYKTMPSDSSVKYILMLFMLHVPGKDSTSTEHHHAPQTLPFKAVTSHPWDNPGREQWKQWKQVDPSSLFSMCTKHTIALTGTQISSNTYNFNDFVYEPSEHRDQENTCCHYYHWITQKMPPKWQ